MLFLRDLSEVTNIIFFRKKQQQTQKKPEV